MKTLKQLQVVHDALAKIAKGNVVSDDNGTHGKSYKCHYWDFELVRDEARKELEILQARYALTSQVDKLKEVMEKIKNLPPAKMIMIFKLEKAMEITGTKVYEFQGRKLNPKITTEYIYIPQDIIDGDFTSFTETAKKAVDKNGDETPIINLKLDSCIIDVVKEEINARNEVWKQARAYVTAVSYRAMQIVGKIMYSEKSNRLRLHGLLDKLELDSM